MTSPPPPPPKGGSGSTADKLQIVATPDRPTSAIVLAIASVAAIVVLVVALTIANGANLVTSQSINVDGALENPVVVGSSDSNSSSSAQSNEESSAGEPCPEGCAPDQPDCIECNKNAASNSTSTASTNNQQLLTLITGTASVEVSNAGIWRLVIVLVGIGTGVILLGVGLGAAASLTRKMAVFLDKSGRLQIHDLEVPQKAEDAESEVDAAEQPDRVSVTKQSVSAITGVFSSFFGSAKDLRTPVVTLLVGLLILLLAFGLAWRLTEIPVVTDQRIGFESTTGTTIAGSPPSTAAPTGDAATDQS